MYTIYRGGDAHTDRAFTLNATIGGTRIVTVMMDVSRITDRHREVIGRRALDTLANLRPDLEAAATATDALGFAKRYAFPDTDVTLSLSHTIDQETGRGPVYVDYTHTNGGGNYPDTADVIDARGNVITLPPVDYSTVVN
jgi:hypothetical protein